MSYRLKVVSRLPAAKHLRWNHESDRWSELGVSAYRDLGLRFCCHPLLLADRHCLDVREVDDTHPEVIGGVIHVPSALTRLDRNMAIYHGIARTLLLREKLVPESPAVDAVMATLALPRIVAMRVYLSELERVNPHAPVEYLRLIYMSHRGSGEMPTAV